MDILKLLVALLAVFSTGAYGNAKHYSVEKNEYGDTVQFRTGAIGAIEVPVDVLKNTKVATFDGLVFKFEDGSNFSMETITDQEAGFIGVDMRSWPEYVLGLKESGSEPKEYIEGLVSSKSAVIDKRVNPFEVRQFSTLEGTGYWAVGKERSALILVSDTVKDQVAVFFTSGMSEQDIVKSIINGVIK